MRKLNVTTAPARDGVTQNTSGLKNDTRSALAAGLLSSLAMTASPAMPVPRWCAPSSLVAGA